MDIKDTLDTGQTEQGPEKIATPTRKVSNTFINPVGPQEAAKTTTPTPLVFEKEKPSQGLSQRPPIQSSDLGNFSKKRTRLDTPGTIAESQAAELTGTPQSNRMDNLFPGAPEHKSLKEMVGKLLEVIKAGFPLANKSRATENISVNVESATDILVLTGAVYDQVLCEDARRNYTTPESLTGSQKKGRSIIFKGRETKDKLDVIVEELAALRSAIGQKHIPVPSKMTQPTTLYALAASKHAPANNTNTTSTTTSKAKVSPHKQSNWTQPTNVIKSRCQNNTPEPIKRQADPRT
ncbi:uncharacterized protein MELLADRAFT_66132 [Melampsora larici-populina 98AG31]|uniref:Uncharacterized protein n=1 Tax=Melampsora larici-populina (strain 98AG31 / pathotype 3-4-7) TaxID=747676 RepID=F4RY05_MELLP|nr:uncharacterized protein MELLADRAFT_66132 [Melampsora larici-populina 98AG31]EGG02599.1 hypothetical protein MELLADRAFT_66132 [Melampsora larici-populina 98AG31]